MVTSFRSTMMGIIWEQVGVKMVFWALNRYGRRSEAEARTEISFALEL